MSITYADDISDGQKSLIFGKILGRWKGSLYKLVWVDLLIYISMYYILNLTYRFAMSENQKRMFESIVLFCERAKGNIPISFLLGFFVAGIITRWYSMYMYIPWMNEVALDVAASINGRDEAGTRKIRMTIMRYLNLSWILMMRLISDQIAIRFSAGDGYAFEGNDKPTSPKRRTAVSKQKISRNTCHPWSIDQTDAFRSLTSRNSNHPRHTTDATTPDACTPLTPLTASPIPGEEDYFPCPDAFQALDDNKLRKDLASFNQDKQVKRTFGIIITKDEIDAFERTAIECYRRTKTKYTPEYWIPIQWAQRLALKALQNGYILDPKTAYIIIDRIGDVRKQMQDLQIFSSIMIPLVYTQVVIIAVYSYFMCQLFACQFVENRGGNNKEDNIDLYIPIFSIFSFLFHMGWLKVALCVMNPFGDDDEDFQTSSILDYNLEVSYRSVYMDPVSFPANLSFPLGGKIKEGQHSDLQDFLNEIDCDLNKKFDQPAEKNFSNLEVRPTRMSKCRRLMCCSHPPADSPSRRYSQLKIFGMSEIRIHRSEAH
ncbi:unnamed protein product [Calicophoron daubneyi]|uniref:Bestrophin homolog n=1 Tax=Calicophoron daubneyi TaxID=300641 RepID=A0AAV2TVL4_CALDB